jgi:hypothetical protein
MSFLLQFLRALYLYWSVQAFYHFDIESDDVAMQIAHRYCKSCTFLDPIAVCIRVVYFWRDIQLIFTKCFQVPIIIHRRDLEKIAPLWLSKTIEIRQDRKNWPKFGPSDPVGIVHLITHKKSQPKTDIESNRILYILIYFQR